VGCCDRGDALAGRANLLGEMFCPTTGQERIGDLSRSQQPVGFGSNILESSRALIPQPIAAASVKPSRSRKCMAGQHCATQEGSRGRGCNDLDSDRDMHMCA